MNQLYPIIRRIRRPLVPVDDPCGSRREEAPSSQSAIVQSLVTSAATSAGEPSALVSPLPAVPEPVPGETQPPKRKSRGNASSNQEWSEPSLV